MQRSEFRGTLRQGKVQATPGTPPYTLKQQLRPAEGVRKQHEAYYTLKMTFFSYGEVVNGEVWKKSAMPIVILYWTTPSSKAYGKESVSDQIFTKEEFNNYIEFFGGEDSPLGQHFVKFRSLYFDEWDKQKVKWLSFHIRKYGILPAYTEPYILTLAEEHIAKFG